jgi:hypothetical protein
MFLGYISHLSKFPFLESGPTALIFSHQSSFLGKALPKLILSLIKISFFGNLIVGILPKKETISQKGNFLKRQFCSPKSTRILSKKVAYVSYQNFLFGHFFTKKIPSNFPFLEIMPSKVTYVTHQYFLFRQFYF